MPEHHPIALVEPTEGSDELQLKKTVFLGYTDIAAGGSRALMGINMRKQYYNIDVPELKLNKTACEREMAPDPREQDFSLVQVLNLMYEEFSIIIVNTVVPPDKSHYVCSKIMDLCTESAIDRLVILSALKVDVPIHNIQEVYENTVNHLPMSSYPPLPNVTRICDSFLSTLIQMIQSYHAGGCLFMRCDSTQVYSAANTDIPWRCHRHKKICFEYVEHQPTSLLLVPAHRACHGTAKPGDGSQQTIEKFQEVIGELTNLSFDTEFSNSLIYKGDNETDSTSVSMMYS